MTGCSCGCHNKNSDCLVCYECCEGPAVGLDLVPHLVRQSEFSERTFGPGNRTAGVIDHIRKELLEIEAAEGLDLEEWIDVVILAFDGAWRAGFPPRAIAEALERKQSKNELRKWPDWRTAPKDKAIEHVREDKEPGSLPDEFVCGVDW